MIIDPKTGITLYQIYKFIEKIIEDNWDNIVAYRDDLMANYDIDDDELDALENKQDAYTADDMLTLARAQGKDYYLQNAESLPDNYNDEFRTATNNFFNLRKRFRPQKPQSQGALNGNTD